MNARLLFLGLAALTVLPAADAPDDASKKDLKQMQGTWKVNAATRGGKDAPAADVASMTLVIDGDKYTAKDSRSEDTGTIKLDAAQQPAAIDVTAGKDAKEVKSGIYLLDGDTLKLAFRQGGKDRPTDFISRPGSDVMVLVLKREQK